MRKLSLKNRVYKRKYVLLALIPISLFLGSLYIPVYLFSHTSNNNLTNLLIFNGIIQAPTDQSLQKQEQPWLLGWNYRKSHTIIGSTAGEQTDYQMKIMVHYGSGNDSGENIYCNAYCRSDFGDIRFAKSDGTTLLDYWMEEKTDGDKATFWVEIDSIPASPQSVNIYVYYGNDGASTTSNGESTFIFFDDFLGSFVDGGKWDEVTNPSGTITVSNSELDLELDSGTGYVGLDSDNSYTAANCIVEAKAKGVHDGGSIEVQSPKMSVFDSQISRNYGAEILFQGTNNIRFAWYTGSWDWHHFYSTSQPTSYKIWQLIKTGSSFQAKYLELDYSEIATSNTRTISDFSIYIRLRTALASECEYDWIRIRNYCDPGPTHGVWGSEEQKRELEIWNDTIITDSHIINNKEIILNGNLTIAMGGSLTLTSITLRVKCTYNGSNRIEVQSGGALYINDTDGNPATKNDATKITSYNPSYRFLFRVRDGATFQMNNSELSYCGYKGSYSSYGGFYIQANNTIILNNTFTHNYHGVILSGSHQNTMSNNIAKYNDRNGFILYDSSYNNLTYNTAINNKRGFDLYYKTNNNIIIGNTVIDNSNLGFYLYKSSNNIFINNTATNPGGNGFSITDCINDTFMGNNVTNNGLYGFVMFNSSNNNFSDNTAISNKYSGYSINSNSKNNILSGNTATDNKYGFYLFYSSGNNLSGNTALNNTYGFYIEGDSLGNNLTRSIVANYLRVEALGYNNNPVQGAEVLVEVDGNVVYASPKFGGSNFSTDDNGLTEWIPVPYKTYTNRTTTVEHTTRVTVSFFELTITDSPREVSMSSSHTETFSVAIIEVSVTNEVGAGENQQVDISALVGVKLSLNLTAPVLSVVNITGNMGGDALSGLAFLGRFISIEVNDTNAIYGITITISYIQQDVTGILNENSLAIWYWNETAGKWIQLPSTVDMENNTVTAYTNHLTHFALLGTPIPPETPGIPQTPMSYISFLLSFLLTPSGLNPLIYFVSGLVAFTILIIGGLGVKRQRAEVPEGEVMLELRGPPTEIGISCVYCGCELSENANFCPLCGKSIAICSVCNRDILSGEVFVECPHCHVPSHRDHLLEWIKVKGYCPNCKERLSRLDVI